MSMYLNLWCTYDEFITNLWWTYDVLMTNLWWTYDELMINLWNLWWTYDEFMTNWRIYEELMMSPNVPRTHTPWRMQSNGDYMQYQTYTNLEQRTEGKISSKNTSEIYRSTDRLSNKIYWRTQESIHGHRVHFK